MKLLTVDELQYLVNRIPADTPKDTAVFIEADDSRVVIKDFTGTILAWDHRRKMWPPKKLLKQHVDLQSLRAHKQSMP